MTPDEFEEQINRLKTQWPRAFGTEIMRKLWMEYRGRTEVYFRKLCDEILDSCKGQPVPKDFREISGRIRINEWDTEKKQYSEARKKFMKKNHNRIYGGSCRLSKEERKKGLKTVQEIIKSLDESSRSG